MLLLAAAGCGGGGPEETPRNVLVVTIDTVRRDAVGFLGAEPSPTPVLDALAGEAVVFRDAYTVAPLTLPAHASLLTGLYPASHGVRDNGAMRVPAPAETLAERLAARGYRTFASVAAFVLDPCFGLDQGFERYIAPPRQIGGLEINVTQVRAETAVDELLAALGDVEAAGPDGERAPWFGWLHLYDPHAPYDAPGAPRGVPEGQAYADEIRYADAQLGRLFDELKRRGLWDELVVVVTSDHGEGLGDGPEPTHGYFVHDPTMRVPLLLRHPDLAPASVDAPVSLVDVVPTLLALLRVPAAAGDFDGVNLEETLRGGPEPAERTLLIECYKPWIANGWAPFEGGVRGSHKAIRSRRHELYDRFDDPDEQSNLAGGALDELFDEVERRMAELAGRLGTESVSLAAGEVDALEKMGYVGAGAALGMDERPPFDALPDTYDKHPLVQRMHVLAEALARSDFDAAVGELRELSRQDPGNPLFLERLGELLLYSGEEHLDEAEGALQDAFRLRPGRPRVHLGLANCARMRADAAQRRWEASGRSDEAARAEWAEQTARLEGELRATLALEPNHPTALFNLSLTLTRKGDRAGDAGARRGHYSAALELLDTLLEGVPPEDARRAAFAQSRDSLRARLQALGG